MYNITYKIIENEFMYDRFKIEIGELDLILSMYEEDPTFSAFSKTRLRITVLKNDQSKKTKTVTFQAFREQMNYEGNYKIEMMWKASEKYFLAQLAPKSKGPSKKSKGKKKDDV